MQEFKTCTRSRVCYFACGEKTFMSDAIQINYIPDGWLQQNDFLGVLTTKL